MKNVRTQGVSGIKAVAVGAMFAVAAWAPQALAQDVLRFGAPLPITGPLAPEALKQQQGYDLWAEQVNKAGGIKAGGKTYKVEIV